MERISIPCEIKLIGSDLAAGIVEGYAAVFSNRDSHGDIIQPGAFAKGLADRKAAGRALPPMRMQHGAMMGADPRPVGVWTSMEEDGRGLRVQGRLIGLDTDAGRYNLALVRDGAMQGLSVGYSVPAGGSEPGGRNSRRLLKAMTLNEVSIVDDPSNALAVITGIKCADEIGSSREFERFLHDRVGFPRGAAKALAAGGWSALSNKSCDDAEAAALSKLLSDATAEIKGSLK